MTPDRPTEPTSGPGTLATHVPNVPILDLGKSTGETTVTLRQWRDADLPAFTQMNADAAVMEYFLRRLTAEESAAFLHRIRGAIERDGWGLWAVDVDGQLAGFTGLSRPTFAAHFTPCVEIGWRLRREFWGRGIAYAAARLAEQFAFSRLGLAELVSFTATLNLRSRRLMERLGLQHDAKDDFRHPHLPDNHPLQPHVLYRKRSPCR